MDCEIIKFEVERNFFPLCMVGTEVAHSLQKNKFLVITFEWKVSFK
jgi:hypothetical protein